MPTHPAALAGAFRQRSHWAIPAKETLWTLIARSGHTYNARDIMRARTTAIRAIWTQTGTYKTCNLDTATPALLMLDTCKTSAWTFQDRQRTP